MVLDPQAGEAAAPARGRFDQADGLDLRARAGRGTLINATFMVGASAITLLQGIVLARLLPTSVMGEWGLLVAAFMTLLSLAAVGIEDKYIQQDDPDQERAFQIAFTLQALLGALFVVVMLVGMPLLALLYGRSSLIAPGLSLALAVPALVLQMPLWTHYRRMDFARQRRLQLIDPVVSFAATVLLIALGLRIWGLVAGAMTGTWMAALVISRSSVYPLRFRWDRAAFRTYRSFSWPLLLAALSTVVLIQVPVTVSSHVYGVSAVAAIALVTNLSRFTRKVDDLVTQTLYPAVCAVRDREDLLYESFWKSNRIALLWAVPLGAATALFAADFVRYVIGEKWHFATALIAAFGINAALEQVAFNWSVFFRAIGRTKPIAVGTAVALVAVIGIAVPLLIVGGLGGFGVGMVLATAVSVGLRVAYLRQVFAGRSVLAQVLAGALPTLPPTALILALRWLVPGERSAGRVLAEVTAFGAATLVTSILQERDLLREASGYLIRGRGRSRSVATPA